MDTKLTKRAQSAVEILRNGGFFRKALESQYKGGEKFKTRLYAAGSTPWPRFAVKGFGYQTWQELLGAGILQSRPCSPSSVWPEEWSLDPSGPNITLKVGRCLVGETEPALKLGLTAFECRAIETP